MCDFEGQMINAATRNSYVHENIVCNRCGRDPLCGARYKCISRNDHDLCEDCMPSDTSEHATIKFTNPTYSSGLKLVVTLPKHRRTGAPLPGQAVHNYIEW